MYKETFLGQKIISRCRRCNQLLSYPRSSQRILITCKHCGFQDIKRSRFFTLSSENKYLLYAGLVGTFLGIAISENAFYLLEQWGLYVRSLVSSTLFVMIFSAFLSGSEGYFSRNVKKLQYGLLMGLLLGFLAGVVSFLAGQTLFRTLIMQMEYRGEAAPLAFVFVRSLSWGVLGLLTGFILGIKENTVGDILFGSLGGLIGGLVGGLGFDIMGEAFQNDGFSRFFSLACLGCSLSFFLAVIRDVMLRRSLKRVFFRRLTRLLPNNLRLEYKD